MAKYIWLKDGKNWKETSDLKGKDVSLQYLDGSSYVKKYRNGYTGEFATYYTDGNVIGRSDNTKPSMYQMMDDGETMVIWWYIDGKSTSKKGKPYKVSASFDGEQGIPLEGVMDDSIYKNIMSGARIEHYGVYSESRDDSVTLSIDDQPAQIFYNTRGNKVSEFWYGGKENWNGAFQVHREGDKPAVIYYNDEGEVTDQRYLLNGKDYNPEKKRQRDIEMDQRIAALLSDTDADEDPA